MRVRRLEISPYALMHGFVTGCFRVVNNPIPADAQLRQAVIDPQTGALWLFIESASFLEIPNGREVPKLQELLIEPLDNGGMLP